MRYTSNRPCCSSTGGADISKASSSRQGFLQKFWLKIRLNLLLPIFIHVCFWQLGLVKSKFEENIENRVVENVYIYINRSTIVKVKMLVRDGVTDPILLRAIAEYCVFYQGFAKHLPRFVTRSMLKSMRKLASVSGLDRDALIAEVMRVDVYENVFVCRGMNQAALENTNGDTCVKVSEIDKAVLLLRRATVCVITGLFFDELHALWDALCCLGDTSWSISSSLHLPVHTSFICPTRNRMSLIYLIDAMGGC